MTLALPDTASLVGLELRVRELDRCLAYYRDVLGFEVDSSSGRRTTLLLGGRHFSLDLLHEPDAPLRPYPCVGLYHFALVLPDRPSLGAVFRRLVELNEPFEGMSDHGVSESLYLRDPEQNGIELYRDRPKGEWPREASGQFAMRSDPLDVDGVVGSAASAAPLHPETRFGHIHLHVPSLEAAEEFYARTIGLGITQRTYFGALFFAAGEYHHHVGANTWAPDREVPEGATGLVSYTWRAPGLDPSAAASEPRDPAGAEVRFEAG